MDNNIRGFDERLVIDKDCEYRDNLSLLLSKYLRYVSNNSYFSRNVKMINKIKEINENIIKAVDLYYCGNIYSARKRIFESIKDVSGSNLLVSELDNNYAFRGSGFDESLLEEKLADMSTRELNFFRARATEYEIESIDEMSYIPQSKRECTKSERFSMPGIPCLYLGVTSYVCWLELEMPPFSVFQCSSIKFNDKGRRLRILNLAITQAFINGIDNTHGKDSKLAEYQEAAMIIYPMIIATSYRVKQRNRSFKSEYIVSQLIMQCLNEMNIDGVAYLSKRLFSEFEFPFVVNLAIPITHNEDDIDSMFEISKPMSLEFFAGYQAENFNEEKSFINHIYSGRFIKRNGQDILYKKTLFSKFDNFLIQQSHNRVQKRI